MDDEKKKMDDVGTGSEDSGDEETKTDKMFRRLGINPNLVMLKVTLFVMYGATASLLPYLTIHMQSIGLTVPEISFVYLALPFTTFLSPPITGFLVDKFGQYKPVVIITLILNAAFHHSLLFIPHQETPGIMPSAYVMTHPHSGDIEIWWSPCPSRECPEEETVDLILDSCLNHCSLVESPLTTIQPEFVMTTTEDENDLTFQSITATANDYLYTTDSAVYENDTFIFSEGNLTSTKMLDEDYDYGTFFIIDMHPDLGEPVEQLGIEMEQDENETVTDFRKRFGEKLLWDAGVNLTILDKEDLRCGGLVLSSNISSSLNNSNPISLSSLAADCMIQKCNFRRGGPEICPPDYKESDDTTFWIYFFLRFLGTIMLSAGVTIMDPIALTMIQKYGGDFGRERLFSSIGMAIFSPITGVLIDMKSKTVGYTDYSAAFYTYDVLLAISAVTVLMMPLGAKLPADNLFRDLIKIIKMPHVILFIFFLFALGNFWGFIESFLFLYLKELGAPNYLLGITVTVGTLSSMPFLYGAEMITAKVGHVNVIVIAFFSHAARLVGYSFIENAWWCFPFEAMESLSVHLMWVAAATYCALLAPKSLLATLIGVLGMAHFSLGRGSGSFCGGLLISSFGTREAFRYMGLVACLGGICYGLLHYFWLRKISNDVIDDEDIDDAAENGESDKLNTEPHTKEVATMVSTERLSMMIHYNPIGSLTSLPRNSRVRLSQGDINELYRSRSNSTRRNSNVEISNKTTPRGSGSKMDLLKSALEINHTKNNISNPALWRNTDRTSNSKLAQSAPKLNQKNISQPALSILVDHERMSRRDSIPEEIEEERLSQISGLTKTVSKKLDKNQITNKSINNLIDDIGQRKNWNSEKNNLT
ncbi:uncharacterized protein LOC143917078 [Arctopsyche grandis]|uniref:uncharacterized protein LOC143917078 n=1 Tax=Arctopsyche grandis TaxID=121162 RepID=UPI00406DA3A4